MTRDWIDDLRHRHPLLYATGFQTESYPDGWASIVRQLATSLENLIAKQPGPERAYLRYAKEKFGTLVYVLAGPVTTGIDQAVRTAIELSHKTCQECGAPGGMRVSFRRWYRVRCDKHVRSDDSIFDYKQTAFEE